MGEESQQKERFVDRLGPALTSGLIIAGLSAVSLGAVALRDLVVSTGVDLTHVKGQLYDHEERLREQEQRPPRLSPDLLRVVEQCATVQRELQELRVTRERNVTRIEHLEKEQEALCSRLQACGNARR